MATLHKLGKLVTLKAKFSPTETGNFVTENSFFGLFFFSGYPGSKENTGSNYTCALEQLNMTRHTKY
jgi:hypothetical protein